MVIWFNQVAHWWTNFENSFYDFQIVLYPDGKIDMNYNTLTGNHTATVGIQDLNGTSGMKVAFDQSYLHDGLSLRFSQGPEWVSVSPFTGTVDGGASETLIVEANSMGLDVGTYEGYLRLVTSGGNAGLPISMLVGEDSILYGDINGDDQINVQDIIFLINYILDIESFDQNQFNSADMNGDGILNIQDVILILNVILR